jgi:UDP-N-acetylmuramoyl-L-alanyl-D-glutamate--2,6-diaminopimelate ligase
MVRQGTHVAVVETTSHALALDKVLGIDYDVAVITNVTHEHLDFHGTWEAYLAAKARLLEHTAGAAAKPGVAKTAILNRDDDSYSRLSIPASLRTLTYGRDAKADLRADNLRLDGHATRFVARTPAGKVAIETSLLGSFNVSNTLAAIGAALALDVSLDVIPAALAGFRGVPGRLETIDAGQPFGVIVDFAHTPNSLRRLLELAHTIASGKVAIVFGCAGLRDVAKRPLMGQAAGELADRVYLTAEDPRTEDFDAITAAIAAGVRSSGREPTVVPDRGAAIAWAIAEAAPGDLVLITGKGHEQTMCFGQDERPWDDRRAATEALAAIGYAPRR